MVIVPGIVAAAPAAARGAVDAPAAWPGVVGDDARMSVDAAGATAPTLLRLVL